jgi:hypothetical protein
VKLTGGGNPVTPDITYKDHRFVVSKVGNGWRATIYAPRSLSPLRESPTNLEQSSKEAIIAEAKWIVDARCTMRADEVIE